MSRTRGRWSCSRSWSTMRSTPVKRPASRPRSACRSSRGAITVIDNGPGMPPETVADILDFSSRVSSREAYVAPDRGAQGNALKTILAMPFVLDGAARPRRDLRPRSPPPDRVHGRRAPAGAGDPPSSRGARCKERHLDHGRLARIQLAQCWPRRSSDSYKSPTTTPGSTRISPSPSPGSASAPPCARPIRHGASGGRRIPPARTGTRPSTSSA